jgi:hypothetical protein
LNHIDPDHQSRTVPSLPGIVYTPKELEKNYCINIKYVVIYIKAHTNWIVTVKAGKTITYTKSCYTSLVLGMVLPFCVIFSDLSSRLI